MYFAYSNEDTEKEVYFRFCSFVSDTKNVFSTKSHHCCIIPLYMQEQDNLDKWKKVHQLFGYILFAKSL